MSSSLPPSSPSRIADNSTNITTTSGGHRSLSDPTDIQFDSTLRKLNTINLKLSTPLTVPTPILHKPLNERPLDPDGKGDSDKQIMTRSAYTHMCKAASLAQVLEEIAKENNEGHKSDVWRNLQDDNKLVMMNVLNTMWHGMVEGLIDGDLLARYFEDGDFRKAIDAHHGLRKLPGNYVQAHVRKEHVEVDIVASTQQTTRDLRTRGEYAGRWLNSLEIAEFHKESMRYLTDPDLTQKVDKRYPGFPKTADLSWYTGPKPGADPKFRWRRYTDNPTQKEKLEEFLGAIDTKYLKRIEMIKRQNPNHPLLKVPFRCCPFEIGYGKDLQARVGQRDHFRTPTTSSLSCKQ